MLFVLMVDALGFLALPPRGPTVDILLLSDSHSQISVNTSQGATMSRMFLVNFFQVLALLRTWRDDYQDKSARQPGGTPKSWPHLRVHGLS
jgi:hypothetical protein